MKYSKTAIVHVLVAGEESQQCVVCKQDKPLESYSSKGEGKQRKCKQCTAEYGKRHYQANKAIYIARAQKNEANSVKRNQDFIRAYKENHPCVDCNTRYPYYVMDFDHLEGFEKLSNVSLLTRQAFSLERIEEEMAKCELVCSNCHRKRTHKRRLPE